MDNHRIMNQAASHWWLFLLRGVVGILFGIIAISSPGAGLLMLAIIFGSYQVLEGGLAIFMAFSLKQWGMLFAGFLSILVGVIAFSMPMLTVTALLWVAAVWAVVIGGVHLFESFAHRRENGMDYMMMLAGAAGILLGGILLAHPRWGLLSIALFVGIYALISGISFVVMSFNLRGFRSNTPSHPRPAAA